MLQSQNATMSPMRHCKKKPGALLALLLRQKHCGFDQPQTGRLDGTVADLRNGICTCLNPFFVVMSYRWTKKQAWKWFKSQGFRQGANFVPSTASNQLEMWQEETWDEAVIERELRWAASFNYNAMRVFLHNLVWEHEGQAFLDRVDRFLEIASSLHMKTMLVLFDACWDPRPTYGPQAKPRPRVHNSRWVQAPGAPMLANYSAHEAMRPYVEAVIKRFGNDTRVLLFDLFNEPDNDNWSTHGEGNHERVESARDAKGTELKPDMKADTAFHLMVKTHKWARALGPLQNPLTVADWERGRPKTKKWVLENSDVITFHNFKDFWGMQEQIQILKPFERPLICSEFMARETNSTFEPILGFLKKKGIWAFNYGLVAGASQTNYPWDSWFKPYTDEPKMWLHDVLRQDGTPYLASEGKYLLKLNSRASKALEVGEHLLFILFCGVIAGLYFVHRRKALVRRQRKRSISHSIGNGQAMENGQVYDLTFKVS